MKIPRSLTVHGKAVNFALFEIKFVLSLIILKELQLSGSRRELTVKYRERTKAFQQENLTLFLVENGKIAYLE